MRRLPSLLLAALAASLAACGPGATPTPSPTAVPTASPTPTAAPAIAIPDRDLFDLARRYRGVEAEPLTTAELYRDEPLGTVATFTAINVVALETFEIEARLAHVGEHALWYVSTAISVPDADLQEAARFFDQVLVPAVYGTFAGGAGPEGRITIVNAPLPGVAGYFSGADAMPVEVYPFSNERVALFMHTGGSMGSASYLGTLAHELQHVVHWTVDPSEDTWVNEGLSELAARILSLPTLPFAAYLRSPGVSLVHWPEAIGASLPNYAAGALFAAYLAERTGIENVHRWVAEQEAGVEGTRRYLEDVAPGTSFEEVFGDWLVANLVGASRGRYAYAGPLGSTARVQTVAARGRTEGSAPQLGAWYGRIEPRREVEVTFTGQRRTPLLPVAPHRGDACWWSNRGDGINPTLTRMLDLRGLTTATLRFWTWFRIEDRWDHGYVAVSTDGGRRWEALAGTLTSSDDPLQTAFGPSYTGASGGWVREEIDLSRYAGEQVLLRFEYVTDESTNTTGWCVDDIEVPEARFFDDAETDGGWEAEGWVRARRDGIAQRFIVRLVEGSGDLATVSEVVLDADNTATFTLSRPTVVVVSPISPATS
ncbi:MAG: immune inhibitor A, partial [Chloroflexi bacterium]|nr:immune inhibitor A [Chloroflexota bacterium]